MSFKNSSLRRLYKHKDREWSGLKLLDQTKARGISLAKELEEFFNVTGIPMRVRFMEAKLVQPFEKKYCQIELSFYHLGTHHTGTQSFDDIQKVTRGFIHHSANLSDSTLILISYQKEIS